MKSTIEQNIDIIWQKNIKIIIKELANKQWFLYDKLVYFTDNNEFSIKKFANFLNWINHKDISDIDDKNELLDYIWDILDIEIIKEEKSILNEKDKIIAKEWITNYLIWKLSNFHTIEELLKILN